MTYLRYSYPKDQVFNFVILDVSVILRENALIISDSFETGSLVEIKIDRMVSLNTMEITMITKSKILIVDGTK